MMTRKEFLARCASLGAMTALPLLTTACATPVRTTVARRDIRSSASDGVRLAVFESGNPSGPPVIFVHGFSQSHESWSRQLSSPTLARECRLIAYDLRGHGESDKPLDKPAYHDNARWAADLASVIEATGADKPVIVAWSYGGRVINDYLTAYGDARLGAIDMVSATSTGERYGLGRSFSSLVGMLSDDPVAERAATVAFLHACFETQPSEADFAGMVAFNAQTPVAVRKLLAGRVAQYDDTLRAVRVPMLITHGELDQISAVAMSTHTKSLVPQAQLSLYPGVGHASFWEAQDRFNSELLSLVRHRV